MRISKANFLRLRWTPAWFQFPWNLKKIQRSRDFAKPRAFDWGLMIWELERERIRELLWKSASHPHSHGCWLSESAPSLGKFEVLTKPTWPGDFCTCARSTFFTEKKWCEALFFRISKFRKWEGAFGYEKTFQNFDDFEIIFEKKWFLENIFLCLWMKSLQRKLSFNVTHRKYDMILKENQQILSSKACFVQSKMWFFEGWISDFWEFWIFTCFLI